MKRHLYLDYSAGYSLSCLKVCPSRQYPSISFVTLVSDLDCIVARVVVNPRYKGPVAIVVSTLTRVHAAARVQRVLLRPGQHRVRTNKSCPLGDFYPL